MEEYEVTDLVIIPRHFMALNAVKARNPLSKTARRAGWVGSKVLLKKLPPDARLYVIEDSEIISKSKVRKEWKKFEFMRRKRLETKGWLNDALTCVRELDKKEFTLMGMYGFEDRLQKLHPDNKYVKDKIKQKLQVLRDKEVVEFVRRGEYKVRV